MEVYTLTGNPDIDEQILENLDHHELHHACLVNRYALNLCLNSPLLRSKLYQDRLINSYHKHYVPYEEIMRRKFHFNTHVHPETGKPIRLAGPVYRQLVQQYGLPPPI
jgi:hypothetical protein